MATYYTLIHKREALSITRETFESVQIEYARQWRDHDGSIPWRMFRLEPCSPRDTGQMTEIDPWTGHPIKED